MRGLPVWWAPLDAPFAAGIVFRVGHADETLPTRGITHLVEHLAIYGAGLRQHAVNGYVDATTCAMHAMGDREEVLGFLAACCGALRELPLERLRTERRVLRGEGGTGGVHARMLEFRFGIAGYGLVNQPQLGLYWLGGAQLQAWVRERFGAANAVLWMTAAPPDDLDLGLGDGTRQPEPAAEALPSAFPANVVEGTGGTALSLLGERSVSLQAAAAILDERLRARVRHDAGLGYAPSADYHPLGGTLVHLLLGSDCEDQHAATVSELIWRTANELAEAGPDAEELDLHRCRAHEAMAQPGQERPRLVALADAELSERPVGTVTDWLDELEELAPADVGQAFAAALESAILLTPSGVGPPAADFHPVRSEPEPVSGGDAFRLRGRARRKPRRLVVGEAGITHTGLDGEVLTLPREEIVGGCWWPEGSLTVYGRDGGWLRVLPRQWGHAEELDAALREAIGLERLVPCADAETTEAVRRLAVESGAADHPTCELELRNLPGLLHDAETPLAVCRSMRTGGGGRHGLLAVTSARVLFLDSDEPSPQLIEVPIAEIETAVATRGIGATLKLVWGGHQFNATLPARQRRHVEGLLHEAMAAAAADGSGPDRPEAPKG